MVIIRENKKKKSFYSIRSNLYDLIAKCQKKKKKKIRSLNQNGSFNLP